MKYFCNIGQKMTISRIEAIKMLYPHIKFVESFDELISVIKQHDEVVFDNVIELSLKKELDIDEIKKNYKTLLDKQVYIIFDKSPNCDSIIPNETYQNYVGNGVIFENKAKAMELLLETQIEACINFKDAIATGTNVSVLFIDKSNQDGKVSLMDASKLGEKVKDGKNQRTVLRPEGVIKIEDTFIN